MQTEFTISTRGPGLYEFTSEVRAWVSSQQRQTGLVTLFVRHTSCSLLIQENADPEVRSDLQNFFSKLVPLASDPSMSYLTHTYEGPDDMPAHIKSALLPVSLQIPITSGELMLGKWQGIHIFEHRDRAQRREVIAHLSH